MTLGYWGRQLVSEEARHINTSSRCALQTAAADGDTHTHTHHPAAVAWSETTFILCVSGPRGGRDVTQLQFRLQMTSHVLNTIKEPLSPQIIHGLFTLYLSNVHIRWTGAGLNKKQLSERGTKGYICVMRRKPFFPWRNHWTSSV